MAVEDNIRAVPWEQYEHMYGPADDVPGWLLALYSEPAEPRREALDELYGSVLHQGDICSVSPVIAPVLVAMGRDRRLDDAVRASLLRLLGGILEATRLPLELWPLPVIAWGEEANDESPALTPEEQARRQLDHERWIGWAQEVRAATRRRIEELLPLLDHPHADIRGALVEILTQMPDRASVWLPPLLDSARVECVDACRAETLGALLKLPRDLVAPHDLLHLLSRVVDARRWVDLAVGVMDRMDHAIPDEVVDRLAARCLAFGFRHDADEVAALGRLDPLRRRRALQGVLRAQRTYIAVLRTAIEMLDAEFGALHLPAAGWFEVTAPGRAVYRTAQVNEDGRTADGGARLSAALQYRLAGTPQAAGPEGAWSLESIDGVTIFTLIGPLLDRVSEVPPPEVARPAPLTPGQREVVSDLLSAEVFWQGRSNVLAFYGLPDTRETLRAWVRAT